MKNERKMKERIFVHKFKFFGSTEGEIGEMNNLVGMWGGGVVSHKIIRGINNRSIGKISGVKIEVHKGLFKKEG